MSDSEEEVSEKHFKICLIGDSQVGKTSIASRYATDNFGKFPNTVGVDVFLKRTTLPGPRHITLKVVTQLQRAKRVSSILIEKKCQKSTSGNTVAKGTKMFC